MSIETADLPLQTRAMAQVRSFDEAKRTFDLIWTTGAKVRRYDWRNERWYDEELSTDPKHVRMERLRSGRAPLLDDHRTWNGVRSSLGVVSGADLKGGEGTASIRFSKRKDAAEIEEDVRDGITTSISVGYRTHKVEMRAPTDSNGVWTYRAIDWEPYELSLTPLPADADAYVRSAGGKPQAVDPFEGKRSFPCEFINPAERSASTQESTMLRSFTAALGVQVEKDADDAAVRSALAAHLGLKADSTDDEIVSAALKRSEPVTPPATGEAPDAVEQARADAQAVERKRNAEIIALCSKHGADGEFQARAIEQGWSAERTGLEILNERHAKGAAQPTNTAHGAPEQRSVSKWDNTIKKFGGK